MVKVRNGFVSNSSSSSFIICGIDFDSREKLLEAYELVKEDLTDDERDSILNTDTCEWEIPEFPGLTIKTYEYDSTITVGSQVNPECMDVSCCMNGFVTEQEKELLQLISTKLCLPITTTGGTGYC